MVPPSGPALTLPPPACFTWSPAQRGPGCVFSMRLRSPPGRNFSVRPSGRQVLSVRPVAGAFSLELGWGVSARWLYRAGIFLPLLLKSSPQGCLQLPWQVRLDSLDTRGLRGATKGPLCSSGIAHSSCQLPKGAGVPLLWGEEEVGRWLQVGGLWPHLKDLFHQLMTPACVRTRWWGASPRCDRRT